MSFNVRSSVIYDRWHTYYRAPATPSLEILADAVVAAEAAATITALGKKRKPNYEIITDNNILKTKRVKKIKTNFNCD